MKSISLKNTKQWLKKINLKDPQKYFNGKTIFPILTITLLLITVIYLVRPIYFNYSEKKTIIENKISKVFQLKMDLKGPVSYKLLPSPRLLIQKAILSIGNKKDSMVNINEVSIPISLFKLNNLEKFKLEKILIENQSLKISPGHLKEYFNYYTKQKKNNIEFKNSRIILLDQRGNSLNFEKFFLNEKSNDKKHQINGSLKFSDKKINIKFLNKIGSEKYLEIKAPQLKQQLDIRFDPSSSLKELSGELKLKIFETIFLLNFVGKDDFYISKSYLRNKFLNSKVDGKISFKEQFFFDLNFGVNKINLRKFLMQYPILETGISKKINGQINVLINNSDSFLGKIKNTKMQLVFENGDLRIKNFSAKLPEKSEIRLNSLILNGGNKPNIEFNLNFYSPNIKKFLRKFGIYDYVEKEFNLYVDGNIDIEKKKIVFKKIIKDNNEKISKNTISKLQKSFNQTVFDENILGVLDFFKFKKFSKENF